MLALMASGHELDIIAIIGIVLLIGIVKKNAIMMIDFALRRRTQRKGSRRATLFSKPVFCGFARS